MNEQTTCRSGRGRGVVDTIRAWALGLAIGTLSILGSSGRVEAQYYGGDYADVAVGFGVAGSLVIGVPAILFTIADIVSFADNTPFDDGWAITETILASLELAGAAILIGIGIGEGASAGSEILILAAIAPLLLGGLHLGHAIWSLTSPRAASRAGPLPFVAPRADGVSVGLGGVF